jgi:hypothetical protein
MPEKRGPHDQKTSNGLLGCSVQKNWHHSRLDPLGNKVHLFPTSSRIQSDATEAVVEIERARNVEWAPVQVYAPLSVFWVSAGIDIGIHSAKSDANSSLSYSNITSSKHCGRPYPRLYRVVLVSK